MVGDCQRQTFFPHGKLNSCVVAEGFFGTEKISLMGEKSDVKSRVFFFLKVKLIIPSMC